MIVEFDVGCIAKVCDRLRKINRILCGEVDAILSYMLVWPIVSAFAAYRCTRRVQLVSALRPAIGMVKQTEFEGLAVRLQTPVAKQLNS